MLAVEITIDRFVDASQPGWVECSLKDAFGTEHVFREKVPIVTTEDLDANSSYPKKGVVACTIIERSTLGGREVVTVDTDSIWGVESVDGETKFKVLPENIVEI
jgi:hypothetical protein